PQTEPEQRENGTEQAENETNEEAWTEEGGFGSGLSFHKRVLFEAGGRSDLRFAMLAEPLPMSRVTVELLRCELSTARVFDRTGIVLRVIPDRERDEGRSQNYGLIQTHAACLVLPLKPEHSDRGLRRRRARP